MDITDILKSTLERLLKMLKIEYSEIEVNEEEKDLYAVNIKSENPSEIIGHHGETIKALQHVLKIISLRKNGTEKQFNISLDADDYKKRQEENVIKIAERKVENLRRTRRPQSLPPMSSYFRRKVHLHLMGAGFDDIETTSLGDGDLRHVVIKLKG
jgi:spoIIIJ-associated protein